MVSTDVFAAGLKFSDDPAYTYMKQTLVCVTHALISNFDIVISLKNRQSVMKNTYQSPYIDAGLLFNNLFIGSAIDLLTDAEFNIILNSFYTAATNHKELGVFVQQATQPAQHMMNLCKYFVIPVRVAAATIPEDIRYLTIKTWLSTIALIAVSPEFANKYCDTLSYVSDYLMSCELIMKNPTYVASLKRVGTAENTASALQTRSKIINRTVSFTKTLARIILYGSLEIIPKYCPNLTVCKQINPMFDGTWINPYDADIRTQYDAIRAMNDYVYISPPPSDPPR